MKVHFIRHSKTFGNTLHRYIGRTNEPLCEEGIELLKYRNYPKVQKVFVSPMIRCIETADIIYNNLDKTVIKGLEECDFGDFENKNYIELKGNEDYQKWIDSNGTMPFPKGDDLKDFKDRCVKAFEKVIYISLDKKYNEIAFVVHGGTIMAIMERYSYPHKDYYEWQVKNGEVISTLINEEEWNKGNKKLFTF